MVEHNENAYCLIRFRLSVSLKRSKTGRYKSRTGSTRTASPGRFNSDRLGSTRIVSIHERKNIKLNEILKLLPIWSKIPVKNGPNQERLTTFVPAYLKLSSFSCKTHTFENASQTGDLWKRRHISLVHPLYQRKLKTEDAWNVFGPYYTRGIKKRNSPPPAILDLCLRSLS